MLSRREQMEFLAYVKRFPIDDESNFHVPSAQLAQIYVNAHRKNPETSDPFRLDEFLVFMPDPVAEIEDDLDRSIAAFLMKRSN